MRLTTPPGVQIRARPTNPRPDGRGLRYAFFFTLSATNSALTVAFVANAGAPAPAMRAPASCIRTSAACRSLPEPDAFAALPWAAASAAVTSASACAEGLQRRWIRGRRVVRTNGLTSTCQTSCQP